MNELILKKFGLSEADTADLIKKYVEFLASLNAEQLAAVEKSKPSLEAIAAAISPDCTVEDLNHFVASRTSSVPTVMGIPIIVSGE